MKKHQGFLTIVTVMLIVVISFLSIALAYMSFGSSLSTANLLLSTQALYLAESGLENATHELLGSTVANRSACSSLSLSNTTIGDGQYSVSGGTPTYVSSPTTLSSSVTATATTIPVASTASYASSGRIMIDQELISYTATNSTNFLNATRGVDGSVAATHATATAIGQYQCALTSTGGVPTLNYTNPGDPLGKRILTEKIQLQEAVSVGAVSSGNYTFARWNRPTELSWTNAATAGSFNLLGVSMLSYADGWAVGNSATFLHWNGSSWVGVASGLSITLPFNDIYCFSKNNCHAVGSSNGATAPIADWNGTSWSSTSMPSCTGTKAGIQHSVHCPSANNCWSVGDIGQSNTKTCFYNWNGSAWSAIAISGLASGDLPYKGVFCPTTSFCWAVGSSPNFVRYNGSSWSLVATGMPNVQYNSIYCTSSSDCWAAGNVNSGSVTLVHYDGTSWSRDLSYTTPNANLNSVACTTADDCWAVGATSSGQPLILHWDGTSWSKFTTSGLANAALNAISLIGPRSQPWDIWSENFS